MRINNCGKLIQKFAGVILIVSIMIFVVIIMVEISNVGIWDFGSLSELIIIEGMILLIGFTISVLFYGFGEIIVRIQKICEVAEDMS